LINVRFFFFLQAQLIKENQIDLRIPPVRLGNGEEISREKVETALRKAVRFTSAIQASDGHWPAEFSGPLFLMPPLVRRSKSVMVDLFSKLAS
jgi:beta-amyrin synthase